MKIQTEKKSGTEMESVWVTSASTQISLMKDINGQHTHEKMLNIGHQG